MTAELDAKTAAAARPMEGHGAYNRSSRVQAAGIAATLPLIERAAAAVPIEGEAPLVIADYGSSQGRNSLLPMATAVEILRARSGPERPLQVVHTDLPGNDFSALFETLAADPDSYLHGDPLVFAAAIGKSFYEPLLPPASVALGWSSWSVQWLSRTPGPIPDHVQVACSRDPAARAAYAAQSAEDWRRFLACRAGELRPGGALVVLTMALDESDDFGYGPLLAALYAGIERQQAEGLVSADEVLRMVIPTVGRSTKDLTAPFAATGSFEGLAIAEVEVFAEEDRIWNDYSEAPDAAAFGARWAAFSRASVFPSLAAALDPAPPARVAAFMDRLESDLATTLAAAPSPMKIPLARVLVTKKA